MSTVLVILVGLILGAAYVLVVYNRASASVVGAALPAATGLLSALVLVFAFTRPTPISRTFSVVFVVEEASLLPIQISERPFPFESLALADQVRQKDPKTFEVPSGKNEWELLMPLYHEFLQKILVDDLANKQFATWRTKTERFVGMIRWMPTPDSASYRSKILDSEELRRMFGKNRFAIGRIGIGKWALPPKTEAQITLPHSDPKLGEVGTIRLKNSLCDLTVRTTGSSSLVGLGKYTPIIGVSVDEAQKRYRTLEYITTIDVSFRWYRMGDTNMDVMREWATGIVDELSFSFDEDSIWNRTKERFLLESHFPQLTPRPAPGPIRFVKPSSPPQLNSNPD